MTVYELLKKADPYFIVEKMMEQKDFFVNKTELDFFNSLKLIREMDPAELFGNESYLFCIKTKEINDGYEQYSLSVFETNKEQLKEILKLQASNQLPEDFLLEPLALKDWDEILGMNIAEVSINEYGMNECATAIYKEMTFLGLFEEERENILDTFKLLLNIGEQYFNETPDNILDLSPMNNNQEPSEEDLSKIQEEIENELKFNTSETLKLLSKTVKQSL